MTIPVRTIRTRDTGKKEWGSGCGSRALKVGQLAQTFPGQDPSSTALALLKPGSAPVLSLLGIPSRVSLREFISVPAAKTRRDNPAPPFIFIILPGLGGGAQRGRGTKPQSPFSQNPAPACSPPTTTTNPASEGHRARIWEVNFQPNAGARGRGRGCGQDGGGAKAENLTACLSREAALQTGRPPLCGRQTERGMRRLLDAGPSHSPAWKRLLLTGILIASCTCSVSLEPPSSASPEPLTAGARAPLPVPGSLNGAPSTSWFREHKTRLETTLFPREGLPGPGHTSGQETRDTQGDPIIRHVTAEDTVLEAGRGRRRATEQLLGKASSSGVMLLTFPSAVQGVIQSDLNYSVILECLASYITPTPVLHWTLDGEPYDTGNMLIIRRLSWGHLGTYVCTAKNSQGEYPSSPVTISLPQDNVEPTDAEPIEPDPVLSVSGGAAIALLVAANVGAMMLIGGVGFTIVQSLRIHRRRLQMCC
ncbi:LOW QUALITY PROTEIN: immunoglobulin superfamily member 23 [Herpailurus yagouaroundi]|uniref:LOW QUALITY PROTEIN: immunoglobulin superfamily member 23 n=1 Tax=Herpailurus yagouaroundi TaxID=1608482 RepID=UPI001AD6327E|nr:LOW QUALITY PROTEIN: immunoglobulin superfamily member 23 [Puma yagouaroundi]